MCDKTTGAFPFKFVLKALELVRPIGVTTRGLGLIWWILDCTEMNLQILKDLVKMKVNYKK